MGLGRGVRVSVDAGCKRCVCAQRVRDGIVAAFRSSANGKHTRLEPSFATRKENSESNDALTFQIKLLEAHASEHDEPRLLA